MRFLKYINACLSSLEYGKQYYASNCFLLSSLTFHPNNIISKKMCHLNVNDLTF